VCVVVEEDEDEVGVVLREVGKDVVVLCVDDVVLGEVVVREEGEVDRNVEGVEREEDAVDLVVQHVAPAALVLEGPWRALSSCPRVPAAIVPDPARRRLSSSGVAMTARSHTADNLLLIIVVTRLRACR
jgi:hypothetical protein